MKVDLSRGDAHCQSMWIVGVNLIVTRLLSIRLPSIVGDATIF